MKIFIVDDEPNIRFTLKIALQKEFFEPVLCSNGQDALDKLENEKPNLIILDLSHNQIESVHVFNEVNFPNLETLDLSYNLISDITPFISSGKRKQTMKSIDNSSIVNSSNITNFLSKSVSSSEVIKKNMALPSLKILKLKNNKINIDEAYLMTVKSLRSRGITIFK